MPIHSPHCAYKSKIVLHVGWSQQGVFFAMSDVGGSSPPLWMGLPSIVGGGVRRPCWQEVTMCQWRDSCTRNLHEKFDASSSVFCTTTAGQPITLHGSCHVPARQLLSWNRDVLNACKKLVGLPEKKLVPDRPTHVQVSSRTRRLAQVLEPRVA